MSAIARLKSQIISGAYQAPTANEVVAPTLMLPGDKDDEELDIWEPSEGLKQTIDSMVYFDDRHWATLKVKERKESMKNFYQWLDGQVSRIVAEEHDKLDQLFA